MYLVGVFGDVCAHLAQLGCHNRYAVALFYAGVGDVVQAAGAVGVAARNHQDWQQVGSGVEVALNWAQAGCGCGAAGGEGYGVFSGVCDVRAHGGEDIDDGDVCLGTGCLQVGYGYALRGAGGEGGGNQEERCRGVVALDAGVKWAVALVAWDYKPIVLFAGVAYGLGVQPLEGHVDVRVLV